LAPKKFPLKPERTKNAIFCDAAIGPAFGRGPAGLCIASQSNVNSKSFTGSPYFTFKEIEVFQIKNPEVLRVSMTHFTEV
jgi:hypothetical protein